MKTIDSLRTILVVTCLLLAALCAPQAQAGKRFGDLEQEIEATREQALGQSGPEAQSAAPLQAEAIPRGVSDLESSHGQSLKARISTSRGYNRGWRSISATNGNQCSVKVKFRAVSKNFGQKDKFIYKTVTLQPGQTLSLWGWSAPGSDVVSVTVLSATQVP